MTNEQKSKEASEWLGQQVTLSGREPSVGVWDSYPEKFFIYSNDFRHYWNDGWKPTDHQPQLFDSREAALDFIQDFRRHRDEEYEQQRLATIVNHAWWKANGFSYVVWAVCSIGVLLILAYKIVF